MLAHTLDEGNSKVLTKETWRVGNFIIVQMVRRTTRCRGANEVEGALPCAATLNKPYAVCIR